MKKIAALCAAVILLVCSTFPAFADDGGFTITNYQVEAVLHENNVVEQTETIDVNFSRRRHGIYRSLPEYMYVSRRIDGKKTVMKYRNRIKAVKVSGAPFDVDSEDDFCLIRIGDEDRTVIGDQRYLISFRYVMPDDRTEDSDFLFYSLLGAEWNTTIDHFSFRMAFDKPLPKASLNHFHVFSGRYGGETQEFPVQYNLTETEITGQADKIGSNQAITVFADLPEGYFTGEVTTPSKPAWVFSALTLLVSSYTILRALLTRRKKPVQTVEFYPPDGVCSAEVGYIIDHSADNEDLISLILWWAQKGYITIEELPDKKNRRGKHSRLILHKEKKLPNDAPEYMSTFFKALFDGTSTIDLRDLDSSFVQGLTSARLMLRKEFRQERALYAGEGQTIILIVVLGLLFGCMLAFSSSIALLENLMFGIVACFALIVLGFVGRGVWFSAKFSTMRKKLGGIAVILICLAVIAGQVLLSRSDHLLPLNLLWGGFAAVAAAGLLCGRITQPTDYNVEITGKLLGLRHFIKTAELPRLKLLVEDNPSYYFDILPYAMVFGLTDLWAKQFRELAVKQPQWYDGDCSLFDYWYFNHIIHHCVQETIIHVAAEAAVDAAGSSVSGGFSGGGGGGGGGGSW